MSTFFKLIMAGCLVCAAPLALACDMGQPGAAGGMSFKEIDKNGDGVISKQEFDAFHSAHFKEMDANKDGKITREEMDAMHKKMADKCDVSYETRFDEVDINHDGGLSKDETEIGMPMLFKHFDEIDTNKDGKLGKDEVNDYMQKMHDKMHGKHGEEMMKHQQ
jgi:Ca2+-binding EF-hand superfamily protein